jgi:fibrillarin-like rRNA methylase
MEIEEPFPGIFRVDFEAKRALATRNLTPGLSFYGEQLFEVGGEEYRSWNPYRSKLAAAILRGMKSVPIGPGDRVLYLGVASGTTCSHISDIAGSDGHVWGVEFSPRPMRDLLDNLARHRVNVSPILEDARSPESYSALVPTVDAIYSDVAQPDQASIVTKNARLYLKPKGWTLVALKSRSVDVARDPRSVYEEQIEVLRRNGFEVEEALELDPYERDHAMVVARFRA